MKTGASMRYWAAVLAGGLAAALLAVALARPERAWRVPQEAKGDLLGMLFGDARKAVSLSLFDRADLYFHGGVAEMAENCPERGVAGTPEGAAAGTPSARTSDLAVDAAAPAQETPAAAHKNHNHAETPATAPTAYSWDPWYAINRRIHPSEHRHLSGENQEKEVVPWLWASIRLDRKNTLAVTVGAYWLARRLNRPDEALALLEDGIRNNPEAADLEFCRGEILLLQPERNLEAVHAFEAALKKWRPLPGNAEEVAANNTLRYRTLMYLAEQSTRNGRRDDARGYYRTILQDDPGNTLARQRLEGLERPAPPPAP